MDPIDQVKQKVDIVDLVSSYLDLKKSGRNYKAVCPFHNEKTPSMMVSPELQIFKCFGCGAGGDILSFHQKIEGVEFGQSLEALAERAGVKLERRQQDPNKGKKKLTFELNDLAAKYYHFILTKHATGKKALSYLKKSRGLTDKTIKEFNIGYAPDSWDSLILFLNKKGHATEKIIEAGLAVPSKQNPIDKFRGRVMFPFVNVGGKIVGFTGRILGEGQPKYLNSPETVVFHKSTYVFGLDKAKVALKKEGAVFVEGQMDVVSANQAGIENALATSGTSLTPGQLKIISRYTKDITFSFDSDSAGLNAAHRAIELAESQEFNVKIAMVPEEHQDLDEMIKASVKKAKQMLNDSIPAYDFYLISALKRNNKNSPIGKRKIMNEIVPLFRKISDPVLRDHYVKEIASALDITESVVADILSGSASEEATKYVSEKGSSAITKIDFAKKTSEEYILALLLKAPLEIAQSNLYKLGQKDFMNPQLLEIFTMLKKYLKDRKHPFKISYFIKKFEGPELMQKVNELYLWDLQDTGDREDLIERELDSLFSVIKKRSAKRELKDLSDKIKQAEMENNKKELKELTSEFKELSEKLV